MSYNSDGVANRRNVYKSNSHDNGDVGGHNNMNGHNSNNSLGGLGSGHGHELNRSSSSNSTFPPPPPPLSSPKPNRRSLSSSSAFLPRPSPRPTLNTIKRRPSMSGVSSSTTVQRKSYKSDDSTSNEGMSMGGGGGGGFPQTYVDHENPHHSSPRSGNRRNFGRQKRKGGSRCRSMMFCFAILVALVLVAGGVVMTYQERVMMKDQLKEQDTMMREQEIDLSMKFDSKIQRLQEENTKLQHKVTDENELKIINQQLKDEKSRLESQISSQKEVHDDSGTQSKQRMELLENEIKSLGKSKMELREYRTKMQQSIELMSKTALLEKFGPGPHRVEVMVGFDSHQGREDRGIFTLEMAPIEDMPHAVYWFLEQVTRTLYDGCSFHRNPGHVLQAGPSPNFLSPPGNPHLNKRFKDAGFHSILYQEYSEKFQHKKYTVGYAGRPGGPDFYVSMKDNSKNHGPGGQFGDPTEADPCFAKVINGFDVIDRMSKTPVQEGSYHSMKDNVAIVYMRIKPN